MQQGLCANAERECILEMDSIVFFFSPFNLVTSVDTGWEFHQQFEIPAVILQYKNQNACLIKCYIEKDLQIVLLL